MKELETSRKCIVSGELRQKEELLRFVLSPEGVVIPDFGKKLPGKGVYVSNSKEAMEKAVVKKIFAKAFKQNVKIKDDLIEMVEAVLRKKALESINLARKSGVLIAGFDKVAELLKKGKAAFVLEAEDAGKDGKSKIRSLAKGLDIFVLYKIEELDKALDKTNTVHIAFKKSEIAKMVYNDCKRLENFLGQLRTENDL